MVKHIVQSPHVLESMSIHSLSIKSDIPFQNDCNICGVFACQYVQRFMSMIASKNFTFPKIKDMKSSHRLYKRNNDEQLGLLFNTGDFFQFDHKDVLTLRRRFVDLTQATRKLHGGKSKVTDRKKDTVVHKKTTEDDVKERKVSAVIDETKASVNLTEGSVKEGSNIVDTDVSMKPSGDDSDMVKTEVDCDKLNAICHDEGKDGKSNNDASSPSSSSSSTLSAMSSELGHNKRLGDVLNVNIKKDGVKDANISDSQGEKKPTTQIPQVESKKHDAGG